MTRLAMQALGCALVALAAPSALAADAPIKTEVTKTEEVKTEHKVPEGKISVTKLSIHIGGATLAYVAPDLRSNVSIEYYDAGHMMYVHPPSMAKFKKTTADFVCANMQ